MRTLAITTEILERMDSLRKSPKHPRIVELENNIATKTRILELRYSTGEPITQADIDEVVRMKLNRDELYARWLEGKL